MTPPLGPRYVWMVKYRAYGSTNSWMGAKRNSLKAALAYVRWIEYRYPELETKIFRWSPEGWQPYEVTEWESA